MIAYEQIIEAVAKHDGALAKALVEMGVPFKMLQDDPYFRKHYSKWVRNARDNYPYILGKSRKSKICMSSLPMSETPVIVCGSGYSLGPALPLLKQWRGEIICGNSNVFTLLAHGILPTYLCVYDSHPEVADLLTSYKRWPDVCLLTHPLINPTLVKKWKGRVRFYMVRREKMEFFDWVLPSMYADTGIDRALKWRVCVVNNEIQVAGALGWAGRPIFLTGCDFGWKDRSKHRCRTYRPSKDGMSLHEVVIPPVDPETTPLSVDDEGWEYSGDMIILRDELYKMWWDNQLPIVDCSEGSLIALPRARLSDVVAGQGEGYAWVALERKKHAEAVADYLNHRVAVKQEQYEKLMEDEDAQEDCVGDSASSDRVSSLVGGDGRAGGQGDTGA